MSEQAKEMTEAQKDTAYLLDLFFKEHSYKAPEQMPEIMFPILGYWIERALESQANAERLREALGHVKMHGRINESMPGHEYGYTDNCHFCPAIAAHDSLVAKHKSASLAAEGFRGEDLLKEKKQGV